jgi:hypothetical protein
VLRNWVAAKRTSGWFVQWWKREVRRRSEVGRGFLLAHGPPGVWEQSYSSQKLHSYNLQATLEPFVYRHSAKS